MKTEKKRKMTLRKKDAITGLIFISPWLIGFIWFFARGMILALEFAFNKLSLLDNGGYTLDFVGLDNFKYAFLEDSTFNQILVSSLIDTFVDVPLIIFFSLFMAILLNGKYKGRTLIRAILFLPVIMNSGAVRDTLQAAMTVARGGVAEVASLASAASESGVNLEYYVSMFAALGFPSGILKYLIAAVSRIYNIVQLSGVQIIIFIAALQSISSSHYEVAKIEGATAYETFWKVTFPMVSPLILTNVVYTIVDSFIDSAVVDKAYDMAFSKFNWGISAAMSLSSSVLICIVLVIVGVILSKKTFYHN